MSLSKKYPQILFWKWDDSHIETRNYREKILDICRRSCFDYIYVGTAWCQKGLQSREVRDCIEDAVAYTHELGRKFIFEIDVRPARDVFAAKYPEGITALMLQKDIVLDERGRGTAAFRLSECSDQFGAYMPVGAEVYRVFSFEKSDEFTYVRDTRRDITERVSSIEEGNTLKVRIGEDKEDGNRSALVMALVWYNLPDSGSEDTIRYFDELFSLYQDIPFDGIALDEWGYVAHPGYNFTNSWRMPWYSRSIEKDIFQWMGTDPGLFYLHMYYTPEGEESARIRYINVYHEMIRNHTLKIERYFYAKVKELFGEDAFVGVHPTWYAIAEIDNSPEIYKNGLNWWDVPRDYGFTDEIMLMPVRTALAHKWKSNTWYNMWYSEGTLDKTTYAREIWHNARYGGRVITLGYETRCEEGVQDLIPHGDLEYVSAAEEKIALLNRFQSASVNSSVLIVMGIPAVCNWIGNITGNLLWNTYNSRFNEVFTLARDLWNAGWNCDLVGSYEIEDGDLYLGDKGKAVYGSQEYDCVIFMFPQFSKGKVLDFLVQMGKSQAKSIVIGGCDRDFEGNHVEAFFNGIKDKVDLYLDKRPEIGDLVWQLRKWGIPTNRVPYGSVLQDGSVILTPTGMSESTGNTLEVDFIHAQHHIRAKFQDLLAFKLKKDGKIEKLAASKLEYLYIDDREEIPLDQPRDIVRLQEE